MVYSVSKFAGEQQIWFTTSLKNDTIVDSCSGNFLKFFKTTFFMKHLGTTVSGKKELNLF